VCAPPAKPHRTLAHPATDDTPAAHRRPGGSGPEPSTPDSALVVVAGSGVEVGGVVESIFDELADVVVGEAVVHEVALTAGLDDAGEAELAEVL